MNCLGAGHPTGDPYCQHCPKVPKRCCRVQKITDIFQRSNPLTLPMIISLFLKIWANLTDIYRLQNRSLLCSSLKMVQCGFSLQLSVKCQLHIRTVIILNTTYKKDVNMFFISNKMCANTVIFMIISDHFLL